MASEYRQLLLSMGPILWLDGVDGTHLLETGNSPRLKAPGAEYALTQGTGNTVGGATSGVPGEKAYCHLIGGLKSAAEVSGLADLTAAGFSCVAIIKPRAWGSSWDRIISFGQAFVNGEIIFSRYGNTNNLHIGWWNGTVAGPSLATTNNALVVGQEQLVVATWNPADGKARLYMDGVKVAESAIAGPATNANRKTWAVGQNCGTTELFDGYITLPAVFNRPLTDAEIASLAAKSTVKGQHLSGNIGLIQRYPGSLTQVVGRTKYSGDIAFRSTPDASGDWAADIASYDVDLDYVGVVGAGGGEIGGVSPDIVNYLGTPVQGDIRVLYRTPNGQPGDGSLVASVTTNVDGTWKIQKLNPALEFDVVCRREGLNDLIWSAVKPAAYVPAMILSDVMSVSSDKFSLTGKIDISYGVAPYTLQVTGSPPPGITFSISGETIVASGETTLAGTFSWGFKVTDSRLAVATLAMTEGPMLVNGDDLWWYVTSALHFDGANGDITITDQKGVTWTRNGAGTLSTAKAKFGATSLRISGIDSDFARPAGAIVSADRFAVSAWVNLDDIVGTQYGRHIILGQGGNAANTDQFLAFEDGKLTYFRGSALGGGVERKVRGTTVVSPDTWLHVELDYDGTYLYLFLNGTEEAKIADTYGWVNTGQVMRIGRNLVPGYETFRMGINGYIDDLQITSGKTRHTANFTAPVAAFSNASTPVPPDPYFANVYALLHFDTEDAAVTSFANKGPGGLVWVPNTSGQASIVADADGSDGKMLSMLGTRANGTVSPSGDVFPYDLFAQSFTLEFTTKAVGKATTWLLGCSGGTVGWGNDAGQIDLLVSLSSGKLDIQVRSNTSTPQRITDTVNYDTVNRVKLALTYNASSKVLTCYKNGNLVGTATLTSPLSGSTSRKLRLAGLAGPSDANYIAPGKFDELRLTLGVVRYTAEYNVNINPFSNVAA